MDEILTRLASIADRLDTIYERIETLESRVDYIGEHHENWIEKRRQEIYRVERDLDATRSELRAEVDRVRRDIESAARGRW